MNVPADRLAGLSPEKRALLARRLGGDAAAPTLPTVARIAIVSAACRLPGGASSPDAYWQLLADGRDAVTEVPPSRWDGAALFSEDSNEPNRIHSRCGGFLDGVDRFDAEFFGISPREAALMDPQQRLLLELAWEALEAAGLPLERLAGSATGVFVGAHSQSSDYWLLQLAQRGGLASHSSTGSAHSILANRVSYALDLRGPSISVDTACSSSLVAVHLACQSLRSGECDLALAGGVNLMLLPSASLAFSQLQILSSSGRCRTFDAAADGIVRGEGCALVALKRLEDAQRDGDPVLATIAGSAVNQDGASNGLTAPNGPAQEAVIRRALAMAAIAPERIGLVETHGTGTPLGDPVEVEALARVIGPARDADHRCLLGAVKTNIGHLEGAAGIAGLIKAVECLRRGKVPANLHFTRPNPHLRLDGTPFAIPTALTPWPALALPRIASVSSFGFGGTNAHVVLEEHVVTDAAEAPAPRDMLFTVSARGPSALAQGLREHRDMLAALPQAALADAAYTATVRRSHHPWRVSVVGATPAELAQRLEARLGALPEIPAVDASRQVVWVFTGQGGPWPGMARELFESEPVFRSALQEVCTLFADRAGWPLLPVLVDPAKGERLVATDVAQPAIFALQVALGALWRSFGVQPGAVVGHSVGEVAAAYTAGVLTLSDAVDVVLYRSRAMHAAFGKGRMAQVEVAESRLWEALAPFGDSLSVAGLNGPASTVISGEPAALSQCLAGLAATDIVARELSVDYAFHSAQMDAFVPGIVDALGGLQPRAAALPLVSSVTGLWAGPGDYGAAYWGRNVREPVRFAPAVAQLLEAGLRSFLEIGPHPALGAGIVASAEGIGATVAIAASLRRQQPARAALLGSLGQLHEAGAAIHWAAQRDPQRRILALPAYPWQRARHWLEAPDPAALAFGVTGRDWQTTRADSALACYEMAWPAVPLRSQAALGRFAGTVWRIVSDRAGFGHRLAREIRAEGGQCDVVDTVSLPETPVSGVVHCVALDATNDSGATSAFSWAQCLASAAPGPRLWLVTRGAQPVDGSEVGLAAEQALLWGLGRSIALEHPSIWGGLVDLDPAASADAAVAELLDQLGARDGEDQAAFRGGTRHVARLESRESPGPAVLQLDAAGAYLITGGYGGLGPKIARWLASCGARCIVIVGRGGPPAGDTAFDSMVDVLRRGGVEVQLERADVADAVAMRQLLERIGRPLRGVVHAAAALRFHALATLGADELRELLRAKVRGSEVLHELTRDTALDLFVLFSSATALFGAKNLAAYAAANQYLGALARQRVAAGLPATCVEWGAWSEIRLLGRERHDDIHQLGFRTMADAAAFDMLARLVCASEPQCMVADMDWDTAGSAYQVHGPRPFLASIVPSAAGSDTGLEVDCPAPGAEWRVTLAALPPRGRRDKIAHLVRTELAAVLALPGPQAVDPAKGFFELGLDSLMAVQLRRRLARLTGVAVLPTATFNHPTATTLADHLLGLLALPEDAPPTPTPTPAKAAPPDAIASLSDDEVRRALMAELEGLDGDAAMPSGGAR